MRRSHLIGSALILTLVVGGCSDSSTQQQQQQQQPPPPGTAMAKPQGRNFAAINEQILQPRCANALGCHNDVRQAGRLDLCSAPTPDPQHDYCGEGSSARDAYDQLFQRVPRNPDARQAGMALVVPCQPEQSFLMTKLLGQETTNDASVGFGLAMPKGDEGTLPAPQIKIIRDWIARGARFDEPADVAGDTCQVGE